ncbi:hypothetical protein INT48_004489 [Thamnidium elegans]|uniref:Uncharacterized protein n=1 Tax=Thamnidium elegans TaxID=101142 RepID=A0A8H7SYK8_9FUNG|nr:hypothetical protein INT48_004489 [Thamnidium elegans]
MLRLDVKSDLSDHWEKLVSRLRYQRNVSKKDPKSIKTTIVSQLRSPTELSSGSSTIEDQMLCLIEKASYEYHVHSLILDPTDKIWKSYFSDDELKEIRCHNIMLLPDLTEEMEKIIQCRDLAHN